MPYRINNKFVSRAVYEAHQQKEAIEAFGQERTVTDTTDEKPTRKPRTTDPVTAATIRVRKAKKDLERVQKLHEKRAELPSLEDAQTEYASAVAALHTSLS